jgi:lipoate-protein ligase B
MDSLLAVRLGLVPYEEGARMQRAVERARGAGEIADTVLLLEHPPVYTQGRRSSADELPMGEDWYRMQGI